MVSFYAFNSPTKYIDKTLKINVFICWLFLLISINTENIFLSIAKQIIVSFSSKISFLAKSSLVTFLIRIIIQVWSNKMELTY